MSWSDVRIGDTSYLLTVNSESILASSLAGDTARCHLKRRQESLLIPIHFEDWECIRPWRKPEFLSRNVRRVAMRSDVSLRRFINKPEVSKTGATAARPFDALDDGGYLHVSR